MNYLKSFILELVADQFPQPIYSRIPSTDLKIYSSFPEDVNIKHCPKDFSSKQPVAKVLSGASLVIRRPDDTGDYQFTAGVLEHDNLLYIQSLPIESDGDIERFMTNNFAWQNPVALVYNSAYPTDLQLAPILGAVAFVYDDEGFIVAIG